MRNLFSFRWLRRGIVGLTLTAVVCHSLGCGTLLHPERRGAPNSGRIDPAVAILDGVGLLLFFVPGVIAFAVDFATGAIYLPPDYYGQAENGSIDPSQCEVIQVPPGQLTKEKLEQLVSEKAGQTVKLDPGSYEVRPLENDNENKFNVLGQSE